MMNIDTEQFPETLLKDISQRFRFLLDRGYEIVSTRYYSQGRYGADWEVLFESPDFSLKIENIEGGRSYSFGPRSGALMSVAALIYLLSGRKPGIFSSEAKLANQLERYIDEIENRYGADRIGFGKAVESAQTKLFGKEVDSAQDKLDELSGKSLVSSGETAFTEVSADEIPKKKSAAVTIIRFLIFWVAYVLILFVLSAYLPILNRSFETVIIISEVFIGFLLAAWTVRKIGTR
jgi:hypothetical protein